MLLETLVALVVMNVTVPVVPDPAYLQQLYPSTSQPPNPYTFGAEGGVTQQNPTEQQASGGTEPTDILSVAGVAITGALAYFFQRNKTVMDRRTYMAADTSLKLAANDQASDAQILNIVYAMTCMADIMGKHYKEDMETYMTRDGVSLWTYIEFLNKTFDQSFNARYISTGQVETTGTQSKDRVVATFSKVQQQITPTPVSTLTQPVATGEVQANKTANESKGAEQKG